MRRQTRVASIQKARIYAGLCENDHEAERPLMHA